MKRKATGKPALKRQKKRVKGDYQRGRELAKPTTELKAFDVASTTISFAAAGTFAALNVPVNGAELYQRVGRKIYMKSLHFRGFVTNTATAVQDVGRVIIFYDSQPNAGAPNLAALLQDSNAAAATTALSEINLTNRQRFKILRDHQIIFPSVTFAGGVLTNQAFQQTDNQMNIDFFIKLKGLETVFNAANMGNIGDITSGSILVCCVAENNAGLWSLTFNSRLRYYD